VEDKAAETKRVTQEVLSKSLEAVKYDYETLLNRLGAQMQELVTRVKQEGATALTAAKREFEDNIWTHKNQTDDIFKSSKAAHSEEVLRLREETR
jgi:DNA-binding ferritin-like protein